MNDSKLGAKFTFQDDEILYYEEDRVTILSNTSPRSTRYIGAMITITNYRIIISQKMLFGGYQIRYIINIGEAGPNFSISGGFVTCSTKKQNIRLIEEKKTYIQIETTGGAWVGLLDVYSGTPQEIMSVVETHY
ncbi:MAG: hypothetical protein JW904_13725 [Spirochaetales bacterium]|nr:hypothetical protein [Spirochaetales bacterium]